MKLEKFRKMDFAFTKHALDRIYEIGMTEKIARGLLLNTTEYKLPENVLKYKFFKYRKKYKGFSYLIEKSRGILFTLRQERGTFVIVTVTKDEQFKS